MPPKRKQLCPGCSKPKSEHHFWPPSKDCEGFVEDFNFNQNKGSKEAETSKDTASVVLDTLRHLSMKVDKLQKEQAVLKASTPPLRGQEGDHMRWPNLQNDPNQFHHWEASSAS